MQRGRATVRESLWGWMQCLMGRSDNNDMSFQSMANIGTTPPSLGLCILSLK